MFKQGHKRISRETYDRLFSLAISFWEIGVEGNEELIFLNVKGIRNQECRIRSPGDKRSRNFGNE